MRKDLGLRMGLAALVVTIAPALATAETCLSPFVKRLDRPEKYLYLFCVDADAKDNDFIAVIDVDPDSPTFGTITYTLDLGSQGERDAPLGLHRRPDADLGGRPVLEPDLDPRRGHRPGQAAGREGARRRPRGRRPDGSAHATTRCPAGC